MEYMCSGNVIKEEPLVNTLMTKSSTERVKAIINPVIIPELMDGRTTLKNAETGYSRDLLPLRKGVDLSVPAPAEPTK